MNDKEKLDGIMNLVKDFHNRVLLPKIGCDDLLYVDIYILLAQIGYCEQGFPLWGPSKRACFDKPAGVPILHGETVDPVMWGFGFSDKKETL